MGEGQLTTFLPGKLGEATDLLFHSASLMMGMKVQQDPRRPHRDHDGEGGAV